MRQVIRPAVLLATVMLAACNGDGNGNSSAPAPVDPSAQFVAQVETAVGTASNREPDNIAASLNAAGGKERGQSLPVVVSIRRRNIANMNRRRVRRGGRDVPLWRLYDYSRWLAVRGGEIPDEIIGRRRDHAILRCRHERVPFRWIGPESFSQPSLGLPLGDILKQGPFRAES